MKKIVINFGYRRSRENFMFVMKSVFGKHVFTVAGSVVKAGIQASSIDEEMGPETATTTNPDTNLLFQSLDSHLRPVTPDPTIPQSMQLYEEHKKYAQEYWSVRELRETC